VFLGRADAIAHDRLVIGVHYPSDLEAGKVLADMFHAELARSSAYQDDLAKARAALMRVTHALDAPAGDQLARRPWSGSRGGVCGGSNSCAAGRLPRLEDT